MVYVRDAGEGAQNVSVAVEGGLEQLNGDSVRSDSRSVRQRADGVCQLLHRGLNSVYVQLSTVHL